MNDEDRKEHGGDLKTMPEHCDYRYLMQTEGKSCMTPLRQQRHLSVPMFRLGILWPSEIPAAVQICHHSPSYGTYPALSPFVQYRSRISDAKHDRGCAPSGGALAGAYGALIGGR